MSKGGLRTEDWPCAPKIGRARRRLAGIIQRGVPTRRRVRRRAVALSRLRVWRERQSGRVARVSEFHEPTEFWLMDYLVEESVELIAATLMLAATVAFLREKSSSDF